MAKKPQLRRWSVDEIGVLPKKLRDQYFGQDTSEWKFKKKTGINDDEIEAISPLLKLAKFKEIYYVPEVDYPQGIKTPDLIIDGVKIEIKTPKSLKKISDVQRYANKQTDNGILLLNLSKVENVTKQEIKQSVEEVAKRRGGSGIVVQRQKILFTYKRKSDSETAIHSVSNPESLYGLILSQKPQKVNSDKDPKLRKQTHAYWQKRSVERTLAAERQALPYIRKARQVYAKSAREITKQVQDIYAKYYRDNGFDTQALRELAPQGDVRRLKARMRKLGLETNLPDNYAYRVSRLEMLNMQMRAEAYDAGRQVKTLTGKTLSNTYQTSYYRTIYDTAKGIGHTPAFSQLNSAVVSKVLDSKNYGKNFSERIWGRSQKLSDELQSIIGTAIATGQSPAKTTRLLRERFNVSASSAERLIRTETSYFENQAELDAYKEMDIEEFEFVATLDNRTSAICQHTDNKVFKVKDAKVGVNVPPLHPYCRSTIAPHLGKEWQPELRIARNPQTGRNEYVTNMSYVGWAGRYVADQAASQGASVVDDLVSVDGLVKYSPMRFAKHEQDWLNEIITQVKELLSEHPELCDQTKAKGGISLETGRSKISKASTSRDNSKIILHRSFLNKQTYLKELQEEMAAGFKVKVLKNKMPIYTITHEIGHVIENFLMGKSVNNDALARSIQRDIISLAKHASGKTIKELQAQVSGYGHQNAREFFAEVYTDYKLNGKSDMAQAMGKYLKSRFNHGKRKNITIFHDK